MNKDAPKIEIFSQGEEVVTGQTVDTNAAWLSQELVHVGFDVTRHTAVGDRLEALTELLVEISRRADGCVCSGGLGPTSDDLTAEAVSRAFGLPLIEDREAMQDIEAYFARHGRHMPVVNRKQALIPQGARRLDNRWGTAPGFSLTANNCFFVFLPGVPSEMRNMFREHVMPELRRRFTVIPWRMVTLRTVGIGESGIQEKLDGVAFPETVELSFRSGPHHIQTKLLFPPDFPEADMRNLAKRAAAAIGKPVFCVDGLDGDPVGDLPTLIGQLLSERGRSVALAETLTGGLVASQCSQVTALVESLVVKDPVRLLHRFDRALPGADQNRRLEAACHVARALREHAGADYGLAQLWFGNAAQPEEATLRLYNVLAGPEGLHHETQLVSGDLPRKQNLAASALLDLLRRGLQGLS